MKIIVYSTPSCPYCIMVKDYFKQKGVKFQDIDVAEDRTAAMQMVEKSGQMGVPVIEIDGEIVIGYDVPKIDDILNRKSKKSEGDESGVQDTAKDAPGMTKAAAAPEEVFSEDGKNIYDVLIIGGSAAGLTAALFATRRAMKTLVLTKDIGGQMSETPLIENWPGTLEVGGPGLAKQLETHAKKFGAEILREEIVEIQMKQGPTGRLFVAKTKDGDEYTGRTVIVAVGKTPRSLDVAGEKDYLGKGVTYCSTCDAPLFRDKVVAVVGGGNSAFDAAIYLCKIATKVYLIHRRNEFRAFESTVEQLKKNPKMEFVLNSVIKEIRGEKFVRSIIVENKVDGTTKEIAMDGIFVEIGSVVNTEFVKHLVDVDEHDQIKINNSTETSCPGIFAAGDVTTVPFKQIIVAAGDGCKAALAAYNYLHGFENKYVAEWKGHEAKKE